MTNSSRFFRSEGGFCSVQDLKENHYYRAVDPAQFRLGDENPIRFVVISNNGRNFLKSGMPSFDSTVKIYRKRLPHCRRV